jgi:hypothetical protein
LKKKGYVWAIARSARTEPMLSAASRLSSGWRVEPALVDNAVKQRLIMLQRRGWIGSGKANRSKLMTPFKFSTPMCTTFRLFPLAFIRGLFRVVQLLWYESQSA